MIQGKGIIRNAKYLTSKYSRSFAGLGSKRKPVAKDLEKYDVVVLGCNLGGIFSRQFDELGKGKYTTMVVFDNNTNEVLPMRGVYEQSHVSKTEYLPNAKLSLNMYTAHSDCIGVDKINPNDNQVVLRNGRKIKYEQLVVAMGLKEDIGQIKGLEAAWQDQEHPVFTTRDHPTWRSNDMKHQKYHYNFTSGDAYFVIPPYPYKGEVGAFNFFLSNEIWKWYSSHGKLSPLHSFTVVNANDSFCHNFDEGDRYIKERAKNLGIRIEYGWKLVEVTKDKREAIFENIKTGQRETRPYGNLYAIPPTVPHQPLVDSGLATKESNYLLDVNRETLRHNKFNNIFGIGDVNNIPTTKTFWGGFYQLQVVRNNVTRNLQGQSLNALYDGYSKSALLLGQSALTYFVHHYDQKPGFSNMWGSSGSGLLSSLRYKYWSGSQKKEFLNYYLLKNWGPPYFKTYQRFKELPSDKESAQKGAADFTAVKKHA
jgi:NADH dehydrogenase FAD-containing subunit